MVATGSVRSNKGSFLIVTLALLVGFEYGVSSGRVANAQAPTPQPVAAPQAMPATPESAKAFLGEWTTTLQAPSGPSTFAIAIKADGGKLGATVGNDRLGQSQVSAIVKRGDSLVLTYSIDMGGNAIGVAITLTPDKDKVAAKFSFADGQFEMDGIATKSP